MTTANDKQCGGQHYKAKPIQLWDFIAGNGIPYLEGNAIKYLCRHREKGGVADLEKAKHYIEKLIEINTTAEPASPFPKSTTSRCGATTKATCAREGQTDAGRAND